MPLAKCNSIHRIPESPLRQADATKRLYEQSMVRAVTDYQIRAKAKRMPLTSKMYIALTAQMICSSAHAMDMGPKAIVASP